MLRSAWTIALKDLRQFSTDKRALALTFLLPMALISIFFYAFGGSPEDGNQPVVSIALFDQDSSAQSQQFIAALDSLKGLRIDRVSGVQPARDAVAKGKRAATLLIHTGFADSMSKGSALPLELVYDSGRPMEYGIIAQLLYGAVGEFAGDSQGKGRARRQMMEQFGMDEATANSLLAQMDSEEKKEPIAPFQVSQVLAERNNDFSLIQAVAGTAVMLLLFSVAGMGAGLLTERESGTLKKLLYAPISPMTILVGKSISAMLVSMAQLALMFLFAALAFGLDLGRNIPALILMIATTALVCTSLSMMLASVSSSRKQLDGLSTIIILTMSAIGGSMMPVVFMPPFLQKMAVGTINYWSIQGFYDIYWRNLGFESILDNAGILLGLSALMLSIAAIFFKRNLLRLL